MSKDEPKAPDPAEIARQQARANRLNQRTPFGSLRFFDPGQELPGGGTAERATAVTELSPELEAITRLLGQRGVEQAEGLPDPNAPVFGDLPGLEIDPAARERAEQATFDRALSLLNPQFERREEALRQRLANQGLPQASRAFESEVGEFRRERSRAEEQAALASVLAGEGVLQGQFGRQLAARGQIGQEQLTERTLPFSETVSLFNLQQGQEPTFFAPSTVDVTGAMQLAQNARQRRAAQRSSALSGLFGLAGGVAGGLVTSGNPAGVAAGAKIGSGVGRSI